MYFYVPLQENVANTHFKGGMPRLLQYYNIKGGCSQFYCSITYGGSLVPQNLYCVFNGHGQPLKQNFNPILNAFCQF